MQCTFAHRGAHLTKDQSFELSKFVKHVEYTSQVSYARRPNGLAAMHDVQMQKKLGRDCNVKTEVDIKQ